MRREGFVVAPERKWEEQKGRKAEKEAPNAGPAKGTAKRKPEWQTNVDSRAGASGHSWRS